MVLLERWGRDHFDDLASTVGRNGLSTLVSRETPAGLDFLRALDQIKKQAQRQISRSTFLMSDSPTSTADRLSPAPDEVAMGHDLEALIQKSLDPREADLINSTIQGDTPADIAARWGVTPKTVSNVKSEAISKLKVTLADRLDIDFRGQ
jgi:DNA-binding NarL/FixJ family response regulator